MRTHRSVFLAHTTYILLLLRFTSNQYENARPSPLLPHQRLRKPTSKSHLSHSTLTPHPPDLHAPLILPPKPQQAHIDFSLTITPILISLPISFSNPTTTSRPRHLQHRPSIKYQKQREQDPGFGRGNTIRRRMLEEDVSIAEGISLL